MGKVYSEFILEEIDAYYNQCLAIEPNEVIGESQYCLIDISLLLLKPLPIRQVINYHIWHPFGLYGIIRAQ